MHDLTICDIAHIEYLYSKVQIQEYWRHDNSAQRLPVVRVVVEEDKCARICANVRYWFGRGLETSPD